VELLVGAAGASLSESECVSKRVDLPSSCMQRHLHYKLTFKLKVANYLIIVYLCTWACVFVPYTYEQELRWCGLVSEIAGRLPIMI
jgi:hypothetical protein